MNKSNMRNKFEEFYLNWYFGGIIDEDNIGLFDSYSFDGKYQKGAIQVAWEFWQAALEIEVTEEMIEVGIDVMYRGKCEGVPGVKEIFQAMLAVYVDNLQESTDTK